MLNAMIRQINSQFMLKPVIFALIRVMIWTMNRGLRLRKPIYESDHAKARDSPFAQRVVLSQ